MGARGVGQEATGGVPRDKRRGQAWEHAARCEGESADKVPTPAAAEQDRAWAAGGTTQDKEPGKGTGTGRARRGASRAPRWAATERMERGGRRSASMGAAKGMDTGTGRIRAPAGQARAQVTGGRTHSADRGAKAWGRGRDPRAQVTGGRTHSADRGAKAWGRGRDPRAQVTGGRTHSADRGTKAWGRGRDPRARAMAPWALGDRQDGAWAQPDVQPVRCILPGIQQMPAHHTHHHHHHHAHLYNMDLDAGELIPPQPPRPQHQPPPPAPRAEPARMAAGSAAAGLDAALAPQAQGPQGEPARGAEGARPWDRDWGTVPDPLGDEALPLVVEVYEWLSWACSGTTRGMRNRPFDAVLLWRDGGNREVPPGGRAAQEDHERILRTVIRAAWPDRALTWPAFLEGGAVLRITHADANNWLPRALRNALTHWRYRRRNPPPLQPQPPLKRRRR